MDWERTILVEIDKYDDLNRGPIIYSQIMINTFGSHNITQSIFISGRYLFSNVLEMVENTEGGNYRNYNTLKFLCDVEYQYPDYTDLRHPYYEFKGHITRIYNSLGEVIDPSEFDQYAYFYGEFNYLHLTDKIPNNWYIDFYIEDEIDKVTSNTFTHLVTQWGEW
jgi:hypothetical protein